MRAEDIKDRESLQAWLEALPQATEAEREEARRWAVAIAHRAAMRVLPTYWNDSANNRQSRTIAITHTFHLFMVQALSAFAPSYDLRGVSDLFERKYRDRFVNTRSDAEAVAFAEGFSLFANGYLICSASAIRYGAPRRQIAFSKVVADAVDFSYGFGRSFYQLLYENFLWDEVKHDCAALQQGEALDRRPLWQDENPLAQLWAETRPKILAQGEDWRFWVDWYDNALHGRPQDYDLLTKIALIDPEDWDKGADHVNALIQQIIAEHKPNSGVTPKLPSLTTVAAIKAHVPVNGPVLSLQLAGLLKVAEAEIERLRCDNAIDPETREALTAALRNLQTAAQQLLDLIPREGALSDSAAQEIGSWAEVLKTEAQHWNREAKKFLSGKAADQRVDLGGRVVLASLVAGPLALMGLPTFATVAGSAILLKDKLKDIPKAISTLRS